MFQFLREFRKYSSSLHGIAAARIEPLKFSYFFQLHLVIAFLIALTLTANVTDVVRTTSVTLQKMPAGVSVEKTGVNLKVSGLQQPYTLATDAFTATIDTTGATQSRPTSSTVFISATAFEIAADADSGRAAQRVTWSDGGDFSFNTDEIRSALVDHESTAVMVMTLIIFAYFFLSSLILSALLVVVWSLLGMFSQRLVARGRITFREAAAVHMVAITTPLTLWGLFVIAGLPGAPLVEGIVFVLYSVLAIRLSGGIVPPAAKSGGAKTEKK
ncbi:MAG: DUF1189 family protein [Candidatus Magasanikbacteria bacterium]|nr:DUF1189 family protein [Candidatus Magasanikbacteria bacterium]